MTYESFYTLINLAVVPAWLMLLLLPRAAMTRAMVHSGLYPLGLGAFYIVVLSLGMFGGYHAEGSGFTTASAVSTAFSHPMGVLIGWSHYLVFDLFVGAWEARDARRRGLSHWLVAPSLVVTFLFGPVGLLLYLIVRAASGKGGWSLAEA
ncbi:MAG: ABA4-like family protein [Hyphomonas sp.]|uniref:ABA4-like family protein n=1 Tax=Hyphomonas sp. TaxID=87 RepID=UPI003527F6A6